MKINTDINILGSLPDWELIKYYYYHKDADLQQGLTHIKTNKSIKRFENAIKNTFLTFENDKIESLFKPLISGEANHKDLLLFLFWNASLNNDLFNYLNHNVFFKALYSGRVSIKNDEVTACLLELKEKEKQLEKWSMSTVKTTASKYLTLLKKLGLLEGSRTKNILHPFLDDKMFVIFIYFLTAVETQRNLLNSSWLPYSFMEKNLFLERLKKKTFIDYYDIYYTGDKLIIEPKIPYRDIYDTLTRNKK